MNAPRERELKYRFEWPEDFARAAREPRLGDQEGVESLENHYFDTRDGLLVRQRVMLRLRRAGHYILGLKIGREARPGFFDSLELEHRVSSGTARRILDRPEELYEVDAPPVRALVERVGVLPLVAVGTMVVERTTKRADGVRLEFDRLVFPDGSTSHELEIETDRPEAVDAWLRGILDEIGIAVEPQRVTKLEQLVAWNSSSDAD